MTDSTSVRPGAGGDEMPSTPSSVHIADATMGPLAGEGRYSRIMPFAATATISLVIAVPPTLWTRPGLAIAGSVLAVAMIVASVAVPWHRIARTAQLTLPFGFLASTLLLMSATGQGPRAPFAAMIVLPLMWLALYENRTAVIVAAALIGFVLAFSPQSGQEPARQATVGILVTVVCCAGMGITLHGIVADARQLALSLREHHLALEHLSLHDPLTDLSNRRGFAAESLIARDRAERERRPFSLLYIDLDHFKELNDTLGHDAGDLLLKEVAERLRRVVRATDTVARLGGDEFAILVEGEPAQTVRLAERIEASLRHTYASAPDVPVSASVGIAHSADLGPEPDALLTAADSSMFLRKRARHTLPGGQTNIAEAS